MFYNKLPHYSTRSWAFEYNGRLAAIAGVQYTPQNFMVFSDVMGGIEIPKMTMWRGALEVFGEIKKLNKPLTAICTGEFINSGNFLKRLGFELYSIQDGQEVYQWQQ